MWGLVGFDHYKIDCIIGVNPEERVKSQTLFIDLLVKVDFSLPAANDSLNETICYEGLSQICHTLAKKEYQLLETFAYEIIDTLINHCKIKWAFVRIKKPLAIKGANYAVVELESGIK